MRIKIIILTLMTLQLCACAVGPNYKRPCTNIPCEYKEALGKDVMQGSSYKETYHWKVARPSDDFNRGEWWTLFDDPQLNALEAKVNICNQSIAQAAAQFAQARGLVDEARAAYFPTLIGSVNVTRQRQVSSFNSSTTSTATTSSGATTLGTTTFGGGLGISTTHTILLNASWEPDLWGSIRRSVEASAAAAQSSGAALAVARLSAQASLAQYYFELRGLDRDQQLLDDTVQGDKKLLQLTQFQYKSGTAALADVVQARSVLEAAQAAAINNHITRAQYEHAIAVLIGQPPAVFCIPQEPLDTTPPPIPIQVPSALLERRPDIAQAERLMAQANAQIGVAVAAYFPSLTLSGSANATHDGLDNWFSLPAINWSIGPQFNETIWDGGLRTATLFAAKANYCATVASYRQTVLAAFQDVEDNLVSLRTLKQQGIVLNKAAADARLALKLVINQYKSGTVPYSSVITAQLNAFTAEKNAADVVYLQMTSAVGLIKALGGGWCASSLDHAADRVVFPL